MDTEVKKKLINDLRSELRSTRKIFAILPRENGRFVISQFIDPTDDALVNFKISGIEFNVTKESPLYDSFRVSATTAAKANYYRALYFLHKYTNIRAKLHSLLNKTVSVSSGYFVEMFGLELRRLDDIDHYNRIAIRSKVKAIIEG